MSDVPFGRESAWSADAMSVGADEFEDAHAFLFGALKTGKPHESQFAKFRYVRDQISPAPTVVWWYRAITVPYWFMILMLAIVPLQRLQSWFIRRQRIRRGHCPMCGYDLRHTAERCPECGRVRQFRIDDQPPPPSNVREPSFRPVRTRTSLAAFLIIACGLAAALYRGSRLEERAYAAESRVRAPIQLARKGELLHAAPATLPSAPPAWREKIVSTYEISDLMLRLQSEAEKQDRKSPPRLDFYQPPTNGSLMGDLVSLVGVSSPNDPMLFGNRLIVVGVPSTQKAVRGLLRTVVPHVMSRGSPPPLRTRDLRPVNPSDLDQRIPELNLQAVDVPTAIDVIRQRTHANIVIDWQCLAMAGISRSQQVTLQLWNVTVGQALRAVCAAAGDKGAISVVSDDELILVGQGQLTEWGELRVYDIREAVDQLLPFELSKRPPSAPDTLQGTSPVEDVIDSIEKVIETEVEPESWKDNGGSSGRIVEIGGRLLITQLPRNHRKIAQLLQTLCAGGSKEGMRIQDAPQTAPSEAHSQ